jgi:hypothetical protein
MVLGPFAETKGSRLPGRTPASHILRTSSLKDLRREIMRIIITKTKGKAARIAPVWRPLSPPDQSRIAAERD